MGKKIEKNESMKYLIDTNIIVDHLRIGEKRATNFLKKAEEREVKASISVITEYELLVSSKISSFQRKIIEDLLTFLPSLSITSSIVREAIRFSQKYQLGMADSLIVAVAFKANAILVSRDKNFQKIKEIKIETLQ